MFVQKNMFIVECITHEIFDVVFGGVTQKCEFEIFVENL